jgi:hypothetical protein
MVTGFTKWALGDTGAAAAAIADAERIAGITGQLPVLGLNFGPTVIDVWRMSMNADAGDPRVTASYSATTTTHRRIAGLPLSTSSCSGYPERDAARAGTDNEHVVR